MPGYSLRHIHYIYNRKEELGEELGDGGGGLAVAEYAKATLWGSSFECWMLIEVIFSSF